MLTVKHIDTSGTERIMQAEKVMVVRDKGIGEDGIFLDPVEQSSQSSELGERWGGTRLAFKDVIHFAHARSAGDTNPQVFIMNQNGATVARYAL